MSTNQMCIIFLLIVNVCFAYEEKCLPNIKVPTDLSSFQLEATWQQRFSDQLNNNKDLMPTFFTIRNGGNAFVGLRFDIWSTLEANASYEAAGEEYTIGGSYAVISPAAHLRAQADCQYYTFVAAKDTTNNRAGNVFGALSLQTDPLFKFLTPTISAGYDFYRNEFGLGTGADICLLENIDIYAEYFPVIDKRDQDAKYNIYSFGLKLSTSGHHFFIFAGNSTTIGQKNCMWGSTTDNLHLGFEVQRLFDFH